MCTLEEALRQFDGKATTALSEIRAKSADEQVLLSKLIGLVGNTEATVSDAATWLIKDMLNDGNRLSIPLTTELVSRLAFVSSWQSQLHLCQSFRFFNLADKHTDVCVDWLRPLLTSDRPFVRAWAMDALQQLASLDPALADKATKALKAAEEDVAASVRARARHWRRRGGR